MTKTWCSGHLGSYSPHIYTPQYRRGPGYYTMAQNTGHSEVMSAHSLPPGTVHLVDLEGTMAMKHADGKDVNDIVLIPRPSDDPDDPLNWSFRRKLLATSCVVVYTMLLAIPSSAVYSVVTPIRKATGLTLTDLNNGTGIMVRTVCTVIGAYLSDFLALKELTKSNTL